MSVAGGGGGDDWRQSALNVSPPATRDKLLRVLHLEVDASAFDEPVRIKGPRVWAYALVTRHSPRKGMRIIHRKSGFQQTQTGCPSICTHQTFSKIVVPAGMKHPSYTSSSDTECEVPKGVGAFHRSNSLIIADKYGRSFKSEKSGSRLSPTTRSISACAFCCTLG